MQYQMKKFSFARSALRIVRIIPGQKPVGPARSVTALGFFDGVHIGHRRLLETACREAKRLDAEPAVFTFADNIQKMKRGTARLTDFDEKIRLFADAGIRTVYVAEFEDVSSLTPSEFVSQILLGVCKTVLAVCGFNFRFGCGASGDAEALRELMRAAGGDAAVIAPEMLDGQTVSASAIRQALDKGDVALAAAMLGRCYAVFGTVEHGKGFGHTEGVPTVNQRFWENAVIPRLGVYASVAYINGEEPIRAVSNVGLRPTLEKDGEVRCETYLIDYTGDLYGKSLRVELRRFLRPEQRFESVEALYRQIQQDICESKRG